MKRLPIITFMDQVVSRYSLDWNVAYNLPITVGHNHAPANYWLEGQLIFNPGSPAHPNPAVLDLKPSIGLLYIDGHNVEGEIVFL